jgi:hypothetical protein
MPIIENMTIFTQDTGFMTVEGLLALMPNLSDDDRRMVRKAYDYA